MSVSKKENNLNEGDIGLTKPGYNSRKMLFFIIIPICCICLVACLCTITLSLLFINYIILTETSVIYTNNTQPLSYIPSQIPTPTPSLFQTIAPSHSPTLYPTEDYEPYIEYPVYNEVLNKTQETNYYNIMIQTSDANIPYVTLSGVLLIFVLLLNR